MNIMKIPKRKPKVGNEPEGNRGGDHGTSRFKKDSSAVPTCSIIYPLKKKKSFIENNHFDLYNMHESILHTLLFSVIYGYKLSKKRDELQHNLLPSLLIRDERTTGKLGFPCTAWKMG